jgi:protein SCO1/2
MNDAAKKSLLPWLVVGLVALVIGVWAGLQISRESAIQTRAITLLPAPRELPELQMVDKEGELVGREAFYDQWSLVFMGFTSCGHICPTKMAEMRLIRDQLDVPLNVVFVSVDPGRDSSAVIKQYVESFDKDFSGMTGSAETIEALANALGAPYFVDPAPGRYIVDHSSALFLIGPDAKLAGIITPPLDIAVIADDLTLLF